jgi:hypothetical protein
MYKLDELLGLFSLTYNISIEDMKRAKKKVLMTHPDKSKLSPEYFLFYKKAFDIVLRFYEDQNRQNQSMTDESIKYQPMKTHDVNTKKITSTINDMSKTDFQHKFNQLFEANMSSKPDPTKNEWFSKDEPIYNIDEKVNSKNMGQVFDKIKDTQASMVRYRGVENLVVNSGSGTRLYDVDDDETDEYVSCDPFSKLKYDDLRKVHKDQTVLAVSERDFQKVHQYSSVDHFMRERGKHNLTPLEKAEAETMLSQQDEIYRQRMMQKEYYSKLKTMEYEQKNKTVLGQFLRLKN